MPLIPMHSSSFMRIGLETLSKALARLRKTLPHFSPLSSFIATKSTRLVTVSSVDLSLESHTGLQKEGFVFVSSLTVSYTLAFQEFSPTPLAEEKWGDSWTLKRHLPLNNLEVN